MRLITTTFLLAIIAFAQEMLTNDAVLKLVKAGLSESLIVNMIQSQPGKYSLAADDLIKLKQSGISDKILGTMVTKASSAAAPTAQPATPGPASELPANAEVGVFWKKAGVWTDMLPEVVNWKTGGVMKSVATVGVVKGDVNGHIQGPHSRNSVTSPLEILIYAPEAVAITEYQLIHLREQKDGREFRTVTGGVMHVSGGATRDVQPFEGTKVANRTYKVLLPRLGAGEYGFLPPGAVGSANSASIGKMYTFRVIE